MWSRFGFRGGVDSSVVAARRYDQRTCVFVNHGMLHGSQGLHDFHVLDSRSRRGERYAKLALPSRMKRR